MGVPKGHLNCKNTVKQGPQRDRPAIDGPRNARNSDPKNPYK